MFLQKRKHLVLSVTLLSIVLNSSNVNAKMTENLPVNTSIFMDELMVNPPIASALPLEETIPTPTPTLPSSDQPEVIPPVLHNVITAELPEATPEKDKKAIPTPLPAKVNEEVATEIPTPNEELPTFLPLHKVVENLPQVEEKLEKAFSTPIPEAEAKETAKPSKKEEPKKTPTPKVAKAEKAKETAKPAKKGELKKTSMPKLAKAEKAKETAKPVKKEEPKKTLTPKPAKVEEEKTTPTPKKDEVPVVTAFPPLPKAMNDLSETIGKDRSDLLVTPTPLAEKQVFVQTQKPKKEDLFSIGYVRVRNSKDKEKFLLKPGEEVQFLEENEKTLLVKAKKGQGVVKKNLLVTSKKAAEQAVKKEVRLFKTTGYCPCNGCSEGYKDHTASGRRAKASHTVAADTSVLPMYTEVYIEGLGRYTVEDVGGGVKGKHIDVFVNQHAQCSSRNRTNAKVYVIRG